MRPHDNFEPIVTNRTRRRLAPQRPRPPTTPSTYLARGTTRGPEPVPPWLPVSEEALDTDLGVIKTGKEADVSLLERAHDDHAVLLAAKRYRETMHRGFRSDAMYRASRQMRDTRAQKAAERGTAKGVEFRANDWAATEFRVLCDLWTAGVAVPYPVQLRGSEMLLAYLGNEEEAAPRLVTVDPEPDAAAGLFEQACTMLRSLSDVGLVHGDLSPYNLLVWQDVLWMIDLPQAVDLIENPNAVELLRRDVDNVCDWFRRRGVTTDPAALLEELLARGGMRNH